jgi:hypothetical protein
MGEGRSLLELRGAARARLSFEASSGSERPWAKLLKLVSSLVEGTEQADITFALPSGPAPARAAAGRLEGSRLAVPQVAA